MTLTLNPTPILESCPPNPNYSASTVIAYLDPNGGPELGIVGSYDTWIGSAPYVQFGSGGFFYDFTAVPESSLIPPSYEGGIMRYPAGWKMVGAPSDQ